MERTNWKTQSFDPKKLQLDPQNPRIEVEKKASPEQIRLKLLELEDVLDLARGIERNKGLFYGERIIVVEEGGKTVVLEGNRRVTACQMLLSPALVPKDFKSRFPKASEQTKNSIRLVAADVSPSRAAAEPILTKRHTEQSTKPWSPVAKMRRAVRLLDSHSDEEVAQLLGTSVGQVRKLIRPYRLLKLALGLTVWTSEERRALEDEKLKITPYTRLFTLAATKYALRAHFDENQNIVSGLAPERFRKELERIVRDFLMPNLANAGKPMRDTRTDANEYFTELIAENKSQGWKSSDVKVGVFNLEAGGSRSNQYPTPPAAKPSTKPQGPAPGTSTQPQTPKASVFFENLQCHIQDDILLKLSEELRNVKHTKMPVAASLLLRAMFESALVYRIRKFKRWDDLMQKQIKQPGRDPSLADLISFASEHANGVFAEKNMCKTLSSGTTNSAKNYLDSMTHMKFQEADPRTLESVANNIRTIIQHILNGN
jgi:hypothetical protein